MATDKKSASMAKYADKVMISCIAIRLVKDLFESDIPFESNPELEAFTCIVLKEHPRDTIYHDQTIAVASILTEHLTKENIFDIKYLQEVANIVAAKHDSDCKEKGVIGRLFNKGPSDFDAASRVAVAIQDIKWAMHLYPYKDYIADYNSQII